MNLIFLILLAFACAVDYYEVLGVDRQASDRELKKAYRALSRQFHPDKNRGDDTAQQKFIEISEAYEVLSDPEQRKIFDRYGSEGLKNGGAHHQDPMEMFRSSFGNMFRTQQNSVRKGPNTLATLEVTLRDVYQQKTQECQIELNSICYECDGTGSSDGQRHKCDGCGGSGQQVLRQQVMPGVVQTFQTTCQQCGGKGTVIKNKCPVCQGTRVVPETRKFNVFLEAGKPRQYDYVLEGEGNQNPDWVPGDLIVRITQAAEDNMGFRRRGNDLFREEALSARQAALGGWTRELTRLDDTTLVIAKKAGERVHNEMIDKIPGEGLPLDDGHGDLYIRYRVIGTYEPGSEHSEL